MGLREPCPLLAKIYFREPDFLYKKNYPNVLRCNEMEQNESHFLIYNYFFLKIVYYVSRDSWSIDQLFYRKSEWMIKRVDEWVCLIDWVSEEFNWLIDWLSEWVSGPVPAWY